MDSEKILVSIGNFNFTPLRLGVRDNTDSAINDELSYVGYHDGYGLTDKLECLTLFQSIDYFVYINSAPDHSKDLRGGISYDWCCQTPEHFFNYIEILLTKARPYNIKKQFTHDRINRVMTMVFSTGQTVEYYYGIDIGSSDVSQTATPELWKRLQVAHILWITQWIPDFTTDTGYNYATRIREKIPDIEYIVDNTCNNEIDCALLDKWAYRFIKHVTIICSDFACKSDL